MRNEERGREPDKRGGDGGRAGDPGRDEDGGPANASGAGPVRARPGRRAAGFAGAVLGPILLTVGYFTIPFGVIGPRHRVLAWLILVGLLTLLAVAMTVTTNRALTDRSGRYRHPGLSILLLSWTAILVFAASYWAMAARHNQFVGLETRLDALYFTGVTMATVGYGDIHPSGQVARAAVLVQIVYTFAFLVGGIAALRTRTQARIAYRFGG